ncbi:MAG: DUF1858 domain-containing protein [Nanoarchaeota archaeon]
MERRRAVHRSSLLGDIIRDHPEMLPLLQEHGIECVGCHVASWETIEQAAAANGIEAESIVRSLNNMPLEKNS